MLLRFLTSRFMSLSYDGQALPHAQAFIRFMMTKTMDSSENAGTAATPSASGLGKVGPAALKWLKENRGLSPGTLAQLDVASGTAFFPDTDRKLPAVYFNYAKVLERHAGAGHNRPGARGGRRLDLGPIFLPRAPRAPADAGVVSRQG